MKILVFMSDNRLLDSSFESTNYNSLSAVINYEYCKKYNYDFLYYRPYLDDENKILLYNCIDPNSKFIRHVAWAKLLSTNLALENEYDYVVYIDSDCIFKNFDKTLEEFIEPYPEKDIIFLNDKPWYFDKPNSGFFVCKVNNYTKQFFIDWYNVNIPEKNKNHPWEQPALYKIFEKYNLVIVDIWMFREEEGQFLRHVYNEENTIRIPYFKNFINLKNIDFQKNINEIKCIHYNTNKDNIIFNSILQNKKYSWNNNFIKFLEYGRMDAFGEGDYKQLDDHIYLAFFGNREHILIFNNNHTEFTSIRKDDNEIIKGKIENITTYSNII
jgi:hypothetical protein